MTKFEEEFDDNVEMFDVIGNHNSMCCEVDQVKEVFKDWQPQQALPVVPECVAEMVERDKQANVSISDVFEAVFSYEDHHLTEAGLWMKNNPEQYIIARNIGYTVEKPQLFYLKHIDMSKADKELDYYLAKEEDGTLSHDMPNKGRFPWHPESRFTQQEIDSMETGSYEQIEVEK